MLLKQIDKNKDHLSDYDLFKDQNERRKGGWYLVEPAVEAYAFLGMFINETIDNKVRKTICEEAWKVCFFFF
jgi:hypothetical protein